MRITSSAEDGKIEEFGSQVAVAAYQYDLLQTASPHSKVESLELADLHRNCPFSSVLSELGM